MSMLCPAAGMTRYTKMDVRLLVLTKLQRWLSSCRYERSYKDGCWYEPSYKDGCPAVGLNGVTKNALRLLL